MRTNRILSAALVACGAIGLSTSAYATNGYQLIGVGAYQKGMGGAVTANENDEVDGLVYKCRHGGRRVVGGRLRPIRVINDGRLEASRPGQRRAHRFASDQQFGVGREIVESVEHSSRAVG